MDPDSYLCRLADLFDGVTVTTPTIGAIIAIILAVILLYASGFVSASEIAFFSLSPGDLSEIEEGQTSSDRRISASELSSEMMDKIICLIIIFFVLKAIPARLVVKLPNGKYFVKENE